MKKLLWKNVWQTAAAILFLLAVWGIAYLAVGNELLVPSLADSLKEGGRLFVSALFWKSLLGSLLRSVWAFALSFLFALLFAVLSYMVPAFSRLLTPVISALRSLPVLAVLLILLTFLGAAEAPVAVAFLSLFPMLYTGIFAALSGIDTKLIEMARIYGARPWRKVTALYIPLCAPAILREAGAALSFSVKLVLSAEVLANTAKSLGGMMQEASLYFQTAKLFALVGAAFFIGLFMELLFNILAIRLEEKIK